jgi:hypothetical protein
MIHSRKILDQNITDALNKHGGFFAFSNDQFEKSHNPKIKKYISLGTGLYAPDMTHKKLVDDINNAWVDHVKRDLKNNTVKDIIWRELANYECQIIDDISDCVDALNFYGITKNQIINEYQGYFDYCIDHDYF